MAFLKKNFNNLIYALVLAVVGVLCIIADTAESAGTRVDAFNAISTTVGIVLIVVASLALVLSIVASFLAKKSVLIAGLGSALILGAGLFFVVNTNVAGELIVLFIQLVPYLLICGSALLVLHGIFCLIFGFVNKAVKEGLIGGIVSILIGAVTMVLGFLTIGNDVCFVGVPGELLAEVGLMMKWCSPFRKTFILYNSTDYSGYFCHPNAFVSKGFEYNAALFGSISGFKLLQVAVENMYRLRGGEFAEELDDWKR